MIELNPYLGLSAIAFGIGFLIAYWLKGKAVSKKVKEAEIEASRIIVDAQ